MAGISLQSNYVYGPILSRRLGRSFGVNLLPVDQKLCSFDCVYCQYGPTKMCSDQIKECVFPSIDDVISELRNVLKKPRTIDYLAFSGNGEPTLHPQFPEIVNEVVKLRNAMRPNLELAIFTNGSRLNHQGILDSLYRIDFPMIKLDAGNENVFQKINRPDEGIEFMHIIEILRKMPRLIIQTLLFSGRITNTCKSSLDCWIDILKELQPEEIHVYSIARPTACEGLEAIDKIKLQQITKDLRINHHLPITAFY